MPKISFGTVINKRYKLTSELGKGGMGIVYRAHDETLKREVAVKLMSETTLGTEGRARLLREAQLTANLNHPNIVTVHDAGEYEENPYIVMELIEGKTLAEEKPDSLEGIIETFKSICQALEHAHSKDIIHRDLKPENVIIDQQGTVKLMDFGLARTVASRLTTEGTLLGTVFYMAPEQAMGDEMDHRVDLYALGVMLYEFVTGELPFEDTNPVAIVSQHLNAPVVPPRARREDLPPALNDLILNLLEKDPDNRPPSATNLFQLFQEPSLLDTDAVPERELSGLDRIVRGRMVGRRKEFEEAQVLWQKAVAGEGELLLISGEPGIGKTRLTREIITHTEVTGGRVLVGAAYAEGGSPYSAFRQILRIALHKTDIKGMDIPEHALADLISLVPDLRDSYPDLRIKDQESLSDPDHLFDDFTVFFNLLSNQRPLMLVLEDMHWADSGTLSLMRHLARQTRGQPLMIVATYREVELDEARPFHETLLDLNREQIGKRLKLSRLDREQTRNMLAAMFASDEITPEFLEGIYRETEGNPFFIEEVCKALVESGKVFFKDGKWDRPSIEEMGIPQGVRVAIQSRLGKLSKETQNVLEIAALIGREFSFSVLAQASDLDELPLVDALEDAIHAQLIEEGEDEAFIFGHALIPTSIVESLRTLKRRLLHEKVGEAIESLHPDNIQALAHHYLEAGKPKKAVEYLLQVGDQARMLYANQEAIHNYLQALDFLKAIEDHDRAGQTLMKLGLSYQNNFDFSASHLAYEEAFELLQYAGKSDSGVDLPPAPHPLRFLWNEPVTLDPAKATDSFSVLAISELFNGLVEWEGKTGNIMPDIATRWEILDEGRRYIFHLREDVYWSDGVKVTAEDFKFSILRTLNPKSRGANVRLLYLIKGAKPFNKGSLVEPNDVGVRVIDDLTLEIELERPVGYFLSLVSYSVFLPLPRHIVEKHGASWTDDDKIVTNGAFRLVSWEKNKRLILERSDTFHGRSKGNIDRVEVIFSSVVDAPLDVYSKDELDFLFFINLPVGSHAPARQQFGDDYRTYPFFMTFYIGFNVNTIPFDDLRVRRAFAMASDKESLAGLMRGNFSPASGGLLPPGLAGHSPGIGLPFNPEKARKLMAKAGYPGGKDFPKIEIHYSDSGNMADGVKFLLENWLEILGVEIDWQPMEWGDYLGMLWKKKPHLWMMGWSADYPDPHNFFVEAEWTFDENVGKVWKNEEYWNLVEKAAQVLNQEERLKLYRQADKILCEEVPILPIGHLRGHSLTKPWVKNFHLSQGPFKFRNVIIEPH